MTVAELVKALAAMPPEARVVCAGFDECGIDDVRPPQLTRVKFYDVSPARDYAGPHDADGSGEIAVWLDWSDPSDAIQEGK